jgi:Flp pilus assembly protein TadB
MTVSKQASRQRTRRRPPAGAKDKRTAAEATREGGKPTRESRRAQEARAAREAKAAQEERRQQRKEVRKQARGKPGGRGHIGWAGMRRSRRQKLGITAVAFLGIALIWIFAEWRLAIGLTALLLIALPAFVVLTMGRRY